MDLSLLVIDRAHWRIAWKYSPREGSPDPLGHNTGGRIHEQTQTTRTHLFPEPLNIPKISDPVKRMECHCHQHSPNRNHALFLMQLGKHPFLCLRIDWQYSLFMELGNGSIYFLLNHNHDHLSTNNTHPTLFLCLSHAISTHYINGNQYSVLSIHQE